MATTLLLDRDGWDLAMDATGNIALAAQPYSQAQDVASAVRVFSGEVYYDTALGVPYFTDVLGLPQPTQILRARAQQAALAVPGVTGATALLVARPNREMGGQVLFQTDAGSQVAII